MEEAVIIDAVRTPIGKYGGALKDIRPDDLAAFVIRTLLERQNLDGQLVDDVIFGCANQAGEDNRNIARMAVLLAGLPVSVPAVTVNRLCGSGLEAVNSACLAVQAGAGSVYIAGGVESMSRAPLVTAKPNVAFRRGDATLFDTTLGWRFVNAKLAELHHPFSMGETAENVAERYGIGRTEQDAFAVLSQSNYQAALKRGDFASEIVPLPLAMFPNGSQAFAVDEHPRPATKLTDLAKLPAAFREGGSVTAGNSSGINDGAAALLVVNARKAKELGLTPMARFVGSAVVGVDPAYMGIGPIPATQKILAKLNMSLDAFGLIEINEAFAAQALACIQELGCNRSLVNVNGGSIALGHPIGASGARILTTLVHEMNRRSTQFGLATMCIGVGQGIATVVSLN